MILIGERRALAAIVLVFYGLLYLLNGLVGPPQLTAMFLGLGAVYMVGFFGVVACWFWARWYATGVALSGAGMGAMLGWQIGLEPFVIFFTFSHLLCAGMMVGQGPTSAYDGRRDWREKWKLDENAVNRLGRSVMRAGASVPYLVMAALAPREEGMALVALGLAMAGLWGLVRNRTWSLMALAAGAGVTFATADVTTNVDVFSVAPWMGASLLVLAVLPFAGPIARFLTTRLPR